jgi:hypothetical protein
MARRLGVFDTSLLRDRLVGRPGWAPVGVSIPPQILGIGGPRRYNGAVDNRRTATRHPVSLHATVTTSGGDSYEAVIENLSLGGAYLTAPQRHGIGSRLRVAFRIPTLDSAIQIDASVRWATPNSTGVQFDGLQAREVWSLNKYFESL